MKKVIKRQQCTFVQRVNLQFDLGILAGFHYTRPEHLHLGRLTFFWCKVFGRPKRGLNVDLQYSVGDPVDVDLALSFNVSPNPQLIFV